MTYAIILSPQARDQLDALYDYIAAAASPATAFEFTGSILDFLDELQSFPHRGTRRDDILPGLRTIGFRRRVLIAFVVETEAVLVLGLFYGGQDFETALRPD